jgi:hypothetical protein
MPDVEQTRLQALERTARSVAQIMKDPSRKLKLLELQKEAEPEAVIPELEAHKAVHDGVAALTKKFDELNDRLQSDTEKRENDAKLAEFETRMKAGREYTAARGYNDEGIQKIEKFMEERGIANHEDAVARYEQLFPPPAPVRSSGLAGFLAHARGDDTDELTKQLIASKGDDNFVLDRMIDQVRREGQ